MRFKSHTIIIESSNRFHVFSIFLCSKQTRGNPGTQSNGTNESVDSMSAEPPEIFTGIYLLFSTEEKHHMSYIKSCFVLLAALLITSLFGCGGGGSANVDSSTSSNGAQTVTSATLVSIAITPTNPSIVKDTNQQFIATGTFSDNTTQDITTTVTWNSSDTSVATISNASGSNGLVTSLATGSTTITATSGSVSGTATLTVTVGGFVSLAWDAPTTKTDGSSLNPATDLSLYKIYYGTASLMYTTVVNVTNPGTTTISKTLNLSPGTYYFSVTTVDTSGQESSYSNEVMKTI